MLSDRIKLMDATNLAIYVHIPFCISKCKYCSFVSDKSSDDQVEHYIKALQKEMDLRIQKRGNVQSVYFGGGTPSLLAARQLKSLLKCIEERCATSRDAEITLEVNPGTINNGYLKEIKNLGVNRLSIGVQSFDDDELAILGRIHSSKEAIEAINYARVAGFSNINIDLIYGIPTQTEVSWGKTLSKAVELAPEHMSLYCLSLEEDARLQREIKEGMLPELDEDGMADKYKITEKKLEDAAYEHYEISNWAKKGYKCRQNITYWESREYLGFGVAAHSFENGRRTGNTQSIKEYISALDKGMLPPKMVDETLDKNQKIAEKIILGLRMCSGINLKMFNENNNIDITKNYRQQIDTLTGFGLIEHKKNKLKLTAKGRLLGNEVFYRFLP